MAYLVKRENLETYLQQKRDEESNRGGAGRQWFHDLSEMYNRKLWHQLTLTLLEFVRRPEASQEDLVALYDNFISDFEMKLNSLYLVEIVSHVISQKRDADECLSFLSQLKEKVKVNQDAVILCSILMCRIKLKREDLKGVKEILEELSPVIDAETGVTPVHGRYFQLASDYYQKVGNHCEYYRNSLRYLGCTDLKDEEESDLKHRAFALALAALLGETIFNFGELLQHPIIEYVKSDFRWLYDLLVAFNAGDLERYSALRDQWIAQPDLRSAELQLRQKISLLSLMELTFKSPNGVLDFSEIAKVSKLPIPEVELLVMKALSLNLVKGTIDEVDQKVHLTWVQPRVLDKAQIATLRTKLNSWCRDVKVMEHLMEQKARDIIN